MFIKQLEIYNISVFKKKLFVRLEHEVNTWISEKFRFASKNLPFHYYGIRWTVEIILKVIETDLTITKPAGWPLMTNIYYR